jgi:hypothetical protein
VDHRSYWRSSENICSSNWGAQEKGKRGWSKQDETQFTTKNGAWVFTPLEC